MVNLYYHTNDPSKRKAVKWLSGHGLAIHMRNLEKESLSVAEIQQLLALSLNGTDDLISKRSRETKKLKMDRDTVTINELTAAIQTSPHILKNPIIFNDRKMVTGFDKEKMGIFIPQTQRQDELTSLFRKLKLKSHHHGKIKLA